MNHTVKYSFINASYWMLFCSIYGFVNFYLLQSGLISSEIGIVLAAGNILAFFLQPLVASFADRTDRYSLNQVILGILFILTIALAVLGFLTTQKFLIGSLFSLLVTLLFVLQPLINAISGSFESHGIAINFGVARSMGSLFFAIASYFIGILTTILPPQIILAVAVIFAGLLFFSSLSLKVPQIKKESDTVLSSGLLSFFREYPHYIGVILGVSCAFFFHTLSNVYMFQILEQYGGSSSDMGLTFALAAVFEVPTMFLFSKISYRISYTTLVKASGFFFFLKSVVLLFANSVFLIHSQQIFQALAFALFIPASVAYVNQSVAPKDRVKGQALMTTANTLGATASTLINGKILTSYGVHTMLVLGCIVSLAGFLMMLCFVKKPNLTK